MDTMTDHISKTSREASTLVVRSMLISRQRVLAAQIHWYLGRDHDRKLTRELELLQVELVEITHQIEEL